MVQNKSLAYRAPFSIENKISEENHLFVVWRTKLFSTAHSPHFKWFDTITEDTEHKQPFQMAFTSCDDTH